MTPPRVSLQILTAREWALFRKLRLEALFEAPGAFSSTFADWQDADEARWQRRLTEVPFNAIAYLDRAPAGMVGATEPDARGAIELISMWVAPFARGQGVGDALVHAVVEWAGAQGAASVFLEVVEANGRARAFYERCGFVDKGRLTKPDAPEAERWMLLSLE
ncbi:MAG TPA: GNAT family N-acetyltransferase [Candidatus Nitrosotalea sp.]|nr:GNAT family N-acetyltransferase [Candidatus Nitrosotalea sp.]